MKIYITSKNTGPSWHGDPEYVKGITTDRESANEIVPEDFRRYKSETVRYAHCPVPGATVIDAYEADGWWWSVAEMDLEFPMDDLRTKLRIRYADGKQRKTVYGNNIDWWQGYCAGVDDSIRDVNKWEFDNAN